MYVIKFLMQVWVFEKEIKNDLYSFWLSNCVIENCRNSVALVIRKSDSLCEDDSMERLHRGRCSAEPSPWQSGLLLFLKFWSECGTLRRFCLYTRGDQKGDDCRELRVKPDPLLERAAL